MPSPVFFALLFFVVRFVAPPFAICMSFFAIMVDRLCAGHLQVMEEEAKTHVRLIDVEKKSEE